MGPKEQMLRAVAQIKGCRYVGVRGNVSARTVVIGEAPGADEDQAGSPFVGYSGQELDRMMAEARFAPSDYWLTNPYKCRPPENDLDRRAELGIPDNIYLEQFWEEIEQYKPTFIIVAGATPLGILCPFTLPRRRPKVGDAKPSIGLWRASLLQSPLINWPHYVIPMSHPAYILRDWSERIVGMLSLTRAREELDYFLQAGRLQPLPERQLITEPSFATALDYLQHCLDSAQPVSVDIELMFRKIPSTIALALSPFSAMSMSFWDYDRQQSVALWRKLDEVLRTKRQIGQNYVSFDTPWLETIGFSPNIDLMEDTLVRHHILWPEFEHKLHFQTFQYTRQPYYKDEGRYWKPKDGIAALQRYNAMDAAVTYEIYLEQDNEFAARPHLHQFYSKYEMELAKHLRRVEQRGFLVDVAKLEELRSFITKELRACSDRLSASLGKQVFTDANEAKAWLKANKGKECLNLGSPTQILAEFQRLGIKVPIKRGTGKQSTGEETLQKIFADTGHVLAKETLNARELSKVKGTYVDCLLKDNVLYSSYVATGTAGGRRSSRENVFGYGTNGQNFPKYSEVGGRYRQCLISRPGHIFVHCDQKGAEDWLVTGIIADVGGDFTGLNELRAGVNRHQRLAAFLFAKPESEVEKHKDPGAYFVAKKTRHAGNYDMQAKTMSVTFAKEGYQMSEELCAYFLKKFHEHDPGIKGVYHPYIQRQLLEKRKLVSPLGRERYFLGLRPFSSNADTFRIGYSYIPQTTVGDNTGMAIQYLEEHRRGWVIQDEHDAVMLEVLDVDDEILNAVESLTKAFDRIIKFPNGLEIKIPIEVELGYNMKDLKTCEHSSPVSLTATLALLRNQRNPREITISGPPPQSSQPLSNVTCG